MSWIIYKGYVWANEYLELGNGNCHILSLRSSEIDFYFKLPSLSIRQLSELFMLGEKMVGRLICRCIPPESPRYLSRFSPRHFPPLSTATDWPLCLQRDNKFSRRYTDMQNFGIKHWRVKFW